MVDISLQGFNVVHESNIYSIDDVTFVGKYSEKFSNYFDKIMHYKELCKNYMMNIDLKNIDFEQIQDIVVKDTVLREKFIKITFEDNSQNKYYLRITRRGKLITNFSDPILLVIKLLQPVLRRRIVIDVDNEYLNIITPNTFFETSSRINARTYSNYRTDVDGVKYGIEFEINSREAWNDKAFKKVLNYLKKKYKLIFEYDGSISFIEVKTLPLEYEDALNVLTELDLLRESFENHFQSDNAGLHIHFTKIDSNSINRARKVRKFLVRNINDDEYKELFGRYPNFYSKLSDEHGYDRYQFINTSSRRTIEVRGGTTKITCNMIKVLSFVKDLSDIINSDREITDEVLENLLSYFKREEVAVS